MSQNQPNKKSAVAQREEAVLAFWQEKNIFQKSLEQESPKGEFVFYDGPPYATGLPHYGHLLPGTMKDVIPRFKTMQGFHVARRWGWDCHGLPIENLIQKELELPTKHDIVEYGVEKFNRAARESVLRYEKEWQTYIPRVGRFVDMDAPYKTMDVSYMEGVWGVFKTLFDKGLVYRGYKSMMVSLPLETVLSNQEVNLGGYHDITDLSATAMFPVTSGEYAGAVALAWTTTPWTLPGNVLLAVGNDISYVLVSHDDCDYIVAAELVEKVFSGKEYQMKKTFLGSVLVNTTYEPPFDYYRDHDNAFRVVSADFVTTEDGTGIVHIAPGFGQDDLEVGDREKVTPIHHVQMDGHFVPLVEKALSEAGYDVAGKAVKSKDDNMHVDIEMVKYLAHHGKLFSKEKYTHSYPVCWRTDCPLINYATESWFIDVQKIKDQLIANNQKTTWVPAHIRDGRFGKWLEDVRDWAVSRSRFWGTPLPLWISEKGDITAIGSVDDLRAYTKKSGNTYYAMRHGQADSNVSKILTSKIETPDGLTEEGKKQVQASAQELLQKNIDLIFVSPFQRTQETVNIVKETLGLSDDHVITDDRLREMYFGAYDGGDYAVYHERSDEEWEFAIPLPDGGESLDQVRKRMGNVLYELEEKYHDKNILIISHGTPLWMLETVVRGWTERESLDTHDEFKNAELRALDFVPLSHNEVYELDLHRPYIDDVVLQDENGNILKRVEDIFDVWFDSGSMPYSSERSLGDDFVQLERFPADFVAEGQDQTRGWFYVMSVLATALYDDVAFKNVMVNGLVLAEDGKKMSKRLKNYPDINEVVDRQGADALRLFLMSSPAVHAEDVNFSEKSVAEVQSKVMGRLRNVLTFYQLYASSLSETVDHMESPSVLDQWMLARLSETVQSVTDSLEKYEIDRGARPLFDFVDDLSTWYIRRSRDRFKEEGKDTQYALATTRFVLETFSRLIAPYVPFVADEIYRALDGEQESVHLADWPVFEYQNGEVLEMMQETRTIISQALELRAQAKIKVRQPLQKLQITNNKIQGAYLDLIKEEVNVKEVVAGEIFDLDTSITPELQAEGNMRELIRQIQSMRKNMELHPDDRIVLYVATDDEGQKLIKKFEQEMMHTAGITEILFQENDGQEVEINGILFKLTANS